MPSFPDILRKLDDNERLLLSLLRTRGPVTRQQLQVWTGFSSSSMHRLSGRLEDAGLIAAVGEADSGGGRKPMRYGIGHRTGLLVGVELSRTEVRVLVCRPNLEPVDAVRFALENHHGPEETMDAIADTLKALLQRHRLSAEEVPGIGLGTVGMIDRERGVILRTTGFLHEGWQMVPVRDMLAERTGLPVQVDNGANMAVLAEGLAGSGQGGDVVYIHLGMGVRTGILSQGRILRSSQEREDVFGHMVVDLAGAPCHCGNRGCLETIATLPALHRILSAGPTETAVPFDAAPPQNTAPQQNAVPPQNTAPQQNAVPPQNAAPQQNAAPPQNVATPQNAAAITERILRAEQMGGEALRRMEAAGHALGVGLANLIRLTDPATVILSGPLIRHAKRFHEVAVETARQQLHALPGKTVAFLSDGHFGEWAIATGAAAHVYGLCLDAGRESVAGAGRARQEAPR